MKTKNFNVPEYLNDMKNLEKTYLGFPNNMKYDYSKVADSSAVYINNCGDPFSTVAWKKHSKFFEQEVLKFFFSLYKIDHAEAWGYMTAGGTEGNMEGLFLAREKYQNGVLYFSEDSHYSIEKIANILRMDSVKVPSLQNGEIDYVKFGKEVAKNKNRPVIVNINCGTTIKGAYDNVDEIKNVLKEIGVVNNYLHVDAALSGMVLPFIEGAHTYTFENGIDSIAISMHKFLGCPIMSGIVLAKQSAVANIMKKIEYVNSHDTTILGSRNGQSPVFVYHALTKYGIDTFKNDVKECVRKSDYLHKELQKIGYNSHLNANSITVYFNKPTQDVVDKWQLACYGDIAHVVVMPHVEYEMMDQMIKEIVDSEAFNESRNPTTANEISDQFVQKAELEIA